MGIDGLDVLGFGYKSLHVMTDRAGRGRRFLRIGLIGPVADRALHALGNMAVGKHRSGRDGRDGCG